MDEKDTKKSTTQGKGKNKTKKQTINLNDFVNAGTTQAGFTAVPAMRWSDVMDDEDEDTNNYGGKNQDSVVILPTAPKSIRGPDIDVNQVPTQPPFICYLSNLPFEASEDDITKFFRDLKITRIDLSRDPGATGRMRGQGTCEFPDRETLIDAFTYNKESIKGRTINLSLNSFETERENYRRERDGDREDRTAGDWRAGKSEKAPGSTNFQQPNRSDSNYFGSNRNRNYENRNNYGGSDSFGGENMNNSRNNYSNYNNRQSNRMEHNNYGNKFNYEKNSDYSSNRYPSSNDSQSQRVDEPPKERPRLVLEKRTLPVSTQPQHQPQQHHHHHHQDNQPPLNTPSQRTSESETKSIEPEKPVERKKLVLKPKTKKDDESLSEQAPKANPSIFGEAKPVDTTKRLLEIEIKKQQELEEQEKLLEDKKLEKEVVEKFEKPARDFNNQRSSNREYNKQRSSDSGSHQGDNNRPHYRENRNDFSQDNRNNNRFSDGNGYRKQGGSGGNGRRLNQTGNRSYGGDNYPNNSNRDFNRENNNRDNYNSRDNQRGNKFSNNNRNNSWNNDPMDNSKRQNHEQNYDQRPNNRQGGNRRDRGNDGFNPPMNKFNLLNSEMD